MNLIHIRRKNIKSTYLTNLLDASLRRNITREKLFFTEKGRTLEISYQKDCLIN